MKSTFHLITDQDWNLFLDQLLSLRGKGRYTIKVEKYRKKRSNDANAFYWSCVVTPLSEHTGYSVPEMHDEILGRYVGWETRNIGGHMREFPRRRTTSPDIMDTMDFKGLIETGQMLAAELGVPLPDQEAN